MSEQNKLAVGYIRVSTEDQASEGVSLDAQEQRIAAWCVAKGYALLKTCRDAGLSAKRADNRPGLQEAIAAAIEHKAALVVYKLDRFARSTKDAILLTERLEKGGADLVSISESIDTTSAIGKLFFTLMAAFAQFERDLTAERTQTAMDHKASNGEFCGGVPYGYRLPTGWQKGDKNVVLEEVAAEQDILRIMRDMRAGGASVRKIASHLNAKGIAPKKPGGTWSASAVHAILSRKEVPNG